MLEINSISLARWFTMLHPGMSILRSLFRTSKTRICKCSLGRMKYSQPCWVTSSLEPILFPTANLLWVMICLEVTGCLCWSTFIHSGDLYSASSRDYYSEALTAQSRTKKKEIIRPKSMEKSLKSKTHNSLLATCLGFCDSTGFIWVVNSQNQSQIGRCKVGNEEITA